jgi:hypothetical protein
VLTSDSIIVISGEDMTTVENTPQRWRSNEIRRSRRRWVRLIATLVLVIASTLMADPAMAGRGGSPFPPAPGPGGELTGNGGKATAVDVVVSGNGLKGRAGRRRASVPLTCWWATAPGPSTDPKAMQAFYDSGQLQAATWNTYAGATHRRPPQPERSSRRPHQRRAPISPPQRSHDPVPVRARSGGRIPRPVSPVPLNRQNAFPTVNGKRSLASLVTASRGCL